MLMSNSLLDMQLLLFQVCQYSPSVKVTLVRFKSQIDTVSNCRYCQISKRPNKNSLLHLINSAWNAAVFALNDINDASFGQQFLLKVSSTITTISLIETCLLCSNHFVLLSRYGINSFIHLRQKTLRNSSTITQFLLNGFPYHRGNR